MRRLLWVLACIGVGSSAFATVLGPGDILFNPALNGTGVPGSSGPFYTLGLPAWLAPANLAVSMSSPIAGIPGFSQFRGTVDSFGYYLNGSDTSSGVGVAYRILLTPNSAPNLVRASLGGINWFTPVISDAGSDESGVTSVTGGAQVWSDGDPYFIERDAFTGAPQWLFRLGANGTEIDPNQSSALVWFESAATVFAEVPIALLDGGAAGAARVITIPEPAAGLSLLMAWSAWSLARRRA